jgi:hypothetical protein
MDIPQLSKPIIIAVVLLLCIAVVVLFVGLALGLGRFTSRYVQKVAPGSIALKRFTRAGAAQVVVLCALLFIPLAVGVGAPSGSLAAHILTPLGLLLTTLIAWIGASITGVVLVKSGYPLYELADRPDQ